jgi:hypothetical protein
MQQWNAANNTTMAWIAPFSLYSVPTLRVLKGISGLEICWTHTPLTHSSVVFETR